MAVLDSLVPSASSDVVAVFLDVGLGSGLTDLFSGANIVQTFSDARPVLLQVSEPTQFMVHPLETGANVTDHRIVLPIEVSIEFILLPDTYRTTYQLMRQAKNLSVRFILQTKTDTYANMYISDLPHEESPEAFDTIRIIVRFKEVQFFNTGVQLLTEDDVLNPRDSSTVDRGEQSPATPTTDQNTSGSILFGIFN